MKKTVEHITSVINLLNEKANYAVLRNYEGLPDKNKSRDIDIIITPESLKKCEKDILNLIVEGGWKVVTYLKSDRRRCRNGTVGLLHQHLGVGTRTYECRGVSQAQGV